MKKEKINKIVIMLVAVLGGAFLGGGLGYFKAEYEVFSSMYLPVYLLLNLVYLGLAVFFAVILHEFGHLLGGLASGYRFLSFRVFDWILVSYPEGYRIKKFSLPGTLGQCLLEPAEKKDGDYPVFLYNYSGIAMNILLFILGMVYFLRGSNDYLIYFSYITSLINLILLVMNLVPMEPNDGYNGQMLRKDQEFKRIFWEILYINSILTRGQEVELAYLEGIKSPIKTSFTAYLPLLMVSDFLVEEEYEKALSLLESLDEDYELISIYSYEIYLEIYFCQTILDWKEGLVLKEIYLSKDLDSYMKMTKTYPSRHRFWIFYYGLVKVDEKKLAQAKENFIKSLKSYPTRGEAVKEEKIVKNLLNMI